MEIKGKLLQKLPIQTGEGKNGTWKKQDIILETEGQYPKKVCVTLFGDKLLELTLKENSVITAHVNPESREHNGKWYTSLQAWKIDFEKSEGITEQYDRKDPIPPSVPAVPTEEEPLPF